MANTSLKEIGESKGLSTPFKVSELLTKFNGYDQNNSDISYSLKQTSDRDRIIPEDPIIEGSFSFYIPIHGVPIPCKVKYELYKISKILYTELFVTGIKVADTTHTLTGMVNNYGPLNVGPFLPFVGFINIVPGGELRLEGKIIETIDWTEFKYIVGVKIEYKVKIFGNTVDSGTLVDDDDVINLSL